MLVDLKSPAEPFLDLFPHLPWAHPSLRLRRFPPPPPLHPQNHAPYRRPMRADERILVGWLHSFLELGRESSVQTLLLMNGLEALQALTTDLIVQPLAGEWLHRFGIHFDSEEP